MILNIKDVRIKNFRSYGDYETILTIDGLGPALIVGELDENPAVSNGAGKSSIVDSIIWCLFGKVPTRDRPGNTVINWNTGRDCLVQIRTCDGYSVTRTRGVDGHDDLLIHEPDGKDISLSTNPNTQQYLNKIFNLDYDIFMSSVFFGQFSKPFLELPDQKRKKALERMLHLTKYDVYAQIAKEKVVLVSEEQTKHKAELEALDRDILRITQQIDANNDELNQFEEKRKTRIETERTELTSIDGKFAEEEAEIQKRLTNAQRELDSIKTYDVKGLEKSWKSYETKKVLLEKKTAELSKLSDEIIEAKTEKTTLEEQRMEADPNSDNIEEMTQKLQDAETEIKELFLWDLDELEKQWEENNTFVEAQKQLDQKIADITTQSVRLKSEIDLLQNDIQKWSDKEGKVCPECRQPVNSKHTHKMKNPSISRLKELEKEISETEAELKRLGDLSVRVAAKLDESRPSVTPKEANAANAQYEAKQQEIVVIKQTIKEQEQKKKAILLELSTRQERTKKLILTIKSKEQRYNRKQKQIQSDKESLETEKPEVTLLEAELTKKQYNAKNQEISAIQSSVGQLREQKGTLKKTIKNKIKSITQEENPYQKLINDLKTGLEEIKTTRNEADQKVQKFDRLIQHTDYIRSAYSDRRKIKAHTIGQMVPFLNQRIAYYLDALECKFSLELNAFLQTKSKKWPYDQNSGGERRRIDLAVTFAIYDLHTSIYEQRCNLLVLDEVDGRLDVPGITNFVNLLYKEFIDSKMSGRPRTILVISHKDEMRDAFPTKILIKKEGDSSRLAEVT